MSELVEVDAPSFYEDQVAKHMVWREAHRLGIGQKDVKWFASAGSTKGMPIRGVFPEAIKSAGFVPNDRPTVLYVRAGQPIETTVKTIRQAMEAWANAHPHSHLKSTHWEPHLK